MFLTTELSPATPRSFKFSKKSFLASITKTHPLGLDSVSRGEEDKTEGSSHAAALKSGVLPAFASWLELTLCFEHQPPCSRAKLPCERGGKGHFQAHAMRVPLHTLCVGY